MKTYDEILERLFIHLRPLAPPTIEVAEDTDLIGTLGLDSTTVINIGMITALLGPGDVAMIDADCHASIYDGCRLSGADVLRFRRNAPEGQSLIRCSVSAAHTPDQMDETCEAFSALRA